MEFCPSLSISRAISKFAKRFTINVGNITMGLRQRGKIFCFKYYPYGLKNVDFVDALVAARMLKQGVVQIFGFDECFDRIPDIQQMSPEKKDGTV